MINSAATALDPIHNLSIGKIIEVDGARVIAELDSDISDLSRIYAGETYPIGQFGSIIRIHFGRRVIYGMVGRLRMKAEYEAEKGVAPHASPDERVVEAELFGEASWGVDEAGLPKFIFERGVSTYPLPQQTVYLTPKSELRNIYGGTGRPAIELGTHVGTSNAPCYADLNELLGKHTAILGSTGSGKSGAVAALLHGIVNHGQKCGYQNWNPRIIVLDPHNEYGAAFADHRRLSTDEGSLALPYWMLNLEETIGLLVGKTEHAATSQANIVKNALLEARSQAASELGFVTERTTVDAPIPYVLGDPRGLDEFGERDGGRYTEGFVGAINAQRPDNKNRKDHQDYGKVLRKLESLINDDRLRFMMRPWSGDSDDLAEILAQLVGEGSMVRVIDLSGVPNEVAGVTTSVVSRMLFSIKVWQTSNERESSPVLLVCEEAHRYVPNRGEAQYEEAQSAIRRIAKEGRKYGLSLLLVSQRPSEVETTVLSQCNSWLVLRTTNDADREHVRGVLPDSMTGLSKMLPGLRRREAIFVGQAAALPSRIIIRELRVDETPKSNDVDFDKGWQSEPLDSQKLTEVAQRWRYQER
ncbi:ATP-binding protein [Salinisphaera sp. LB1]|uniref:ATP-binding protein n=1 Tax=Salinisphaera sp. LB1 TaxID=2183911 RepID=UPI000D7EB0F5|nr:DUF87 domain-containing protein [Salinisphaera sp. LB1]AWN16704.1 Bipolar DNA helicase HerA [Salinisphaera sp. LB1]